MFEAKTTLFGLFCRWDMSWYFLKENYNAVMWFLSYFLYQNKHFTSPCVWRTWFVGQGDIVISCLYYATHFIFIKNIAPSTMWIFPFDNIVVQCIIAGCNLRISLAFVWNDISNDSFLRCSWLTHCSCSALVENVEPTCSPTPNSLRLQSTTTRTAICRCS